LSGWVASGWALALTLGMGTSGSTQSAVDTVAGFSAFACLGTPVRSCSAETRHHCTNEHVRRRRELLPAEAGNIMGEWMGENEGRPRTRCYGVRRHTEEGGEEDVVHSCTNIFVIDGSASHFQANQSVERKHSDSCTTGHNLHWLAARCRSPASMAIWLVVRGLAHDTKFWPGQITNRHDTTVIMPGSAQPMPQVGLGPLPQHAGRHGHDTIKGRHTREHDGGMCKHMCLPGST
jgi:hypothetical protein